MSRTEEIYSQVYMSKGKKFYRCIVPLIAQELCPSLLSILYETAYLQVFLCTGLVGNLVVNEQLAITNLPHDWWTGQWILFSSFFFSSNYFLWQSKKSSIYRCVCSELPDSGKLQLFGRRLLFSLWGKFAGVTTARLLSDKRSLYPHNIYIITCYLYLKFYCQYYHFYQNYLNLQEAHKASV